MLSKNHKQIKVFFLIIRNKKNQILNLNNQKINYKNKILYLDNLRTNNKKMVYYLVNQKTYNNKKKQIQ